MKHKAIWIGALIGFMYSIIAAFIIYLIDSMGGGGPEGIGMLFIPIVMPVIPIFMITAQIVKTLFPTLIHPGKFFLELILTIIIVTLVGVVVGFIIEVYNRKKKKKENEK